MLCRMAALPIAAGLHCLSCLTKGQLRIAPKGFAVLFAKKAVLPTPVLGSVGFDFQIKPDDCNEFVGLAGGLGSAKGCITDSAPSRTFGA